MPCTTGRAFQNLCSTSTCPPINCCRLSTAFSCQPLCPCPILVDSINIDASAEYCAAFKTINNIDPSALGEFLQATLTSIGENIDTLNSNFTNIPTLHCPVTIEFAIPCLRQRVIITNKIIVSAVEFTDCQPTGNLDILVNGKLCLTIADT